MIRVSRQPPQLLKTRALPRLHGCVHESRPRRLAWLLKLASVLRRVWGRRAFDSAVVEAPVSKTTRTRHAARQRSPTGGLHGLWPMMRPGA
eukprot:942346-Prymnesium_polylepis.1